MYGYLPALMEACQDKVMLPKSCLDKLLTRSELAQFLPRIYWVETLDEALEKSTGVVIATTPERQFAVASEISNRPNVKRLILEKPLAPSPLLAAQLLSGVLKADIDFRIGYTFLYCDWYSKLDWKAIKNNSDEIKLLWTFMAHHFSSHIETWKKRHIDGGGVLRFYGIHVIALLASLGYSGVDYSLLEGRVEAEPEKWKARFLGNHLPNFTIEINSSSGIREFTIYSRDAENLDCHLSLLDPFGSEKSYKEQDVRLAPLTHLARSFEAQNSSFYELYANVNKLWSRVEQQTKFAFEQK